MTTEQYKSYYKTHSSSIDTFIKSHVTQEDIDDYTKGKTVIEKADPKKTWMKFIDDIIKMSSLTLNL